MIADRTVALMADFICGANAEDFHFTGANWGVTCPSPISSRISATWSKETPHPMAREGWRSSGASKSDMCLSRHQVLESDERNLPRRGWPPQHFEMGCYGIGVTRILGAAIEQNNDARRDHLADLDRALRGGRVPDWLEQSEAVRNEANRIYAALLDAGVDVIIDDRDERPGVMFADWELIGVPHRVTIGDRGLKEGLVEYQGRRDAEAAKLPVSEIAATIIDRLKGRR